MVGIGVPDLLRGRLGRCSAVAVAGAAMVLTLGAAAAPVARPAAVTNDPGNLYGVSAVSASDAWAVGQNGGAGDMILHWNGTRWIRAAVPSPRAGYTDAVSALSASDAWAVGVGGAKLADKTLVLHWNGTSWTKVPSPSPGKAPVDDQLYGVSALSRDDVWAVGTYGNVTSGSIHALVLHWNGRTWAQTPLPQPQGREGELSGVDALSANDVWAVGDYFTKHFADKTLVLHWNGSRWRVLPSPNPAPDGGGPLYAVSALSATDAWAVGTSGYQRSLVLHWNGTSWSDVASPNPGGTGTASFTKLYSVTTLSPSDAWAVGWYGKNGGQEATGKTLVLHWNGTSWTRLASPSVGKSSALWGVTALSATRAWAAGSVYARTVIGDTLILDWNGTSWTRT